MLGLLKSIRIYKELFKQFGLKYAVFRIKYELSKKLGLFKSKFPIVYSKGVYPTLDVWKDKYTNTFFVSAKEDIIEFDGSSSEQLKTDTKKILSGKIPFFFTEWKDLGFQGDWSVHPISNHLYSSIHWTQLPIYDQQIGDIKYIWEKSKFSFLLYLIRNDLRHKEDNSLFVFKEIERWIDQNPPNIGPQYICSQEISIRLMNWSFALFFYKNSKSLNDGLFKKIMASIEIQIEHVFNNINFSRISVRNNHAVTETLALYLISLYFPFLKQAEKFKKLGKKWFEEEIEFQIFNDGSDSQYSFNYHRVKIQLFCWAISSAIVNKELFSSVVYKKAKKSLEFLVQMIGNDEKGFLPNFGANDGSIYFKLNDSDYRNFLPQLNALASLLNIELPVENSNLSFEEDEFWFTQKIHGERLNKLKLIQGMNNFPLGGYVQFRDNNTLTLLKTPEMSFRAGQDDLLHLDVWVNGINVFKDTGSYSYNTDEVTKTSFNGVSGHNTASLKGEQHMLKGPRFTWLYKPKHLSTELLENDEFYEVTSIMQVFYPEHYTLRRTVKKYKSKLRWIIEDTILEYKIAGPSLTQFWNLEANLPFKVLISVEDENLADVQAVVEEGYHSVYYGIKEKTKKIIYNTNGKSLKTIIEISI